MDPSTLASLKTTAVLLVKTVECPICLEVLADPLSTNCHHRFCRSCIEKALHGKYKIPCPLCKEVVTKRSLQKIDHIEQIVQKVKRLSEAIREDTGIDVTPPRKPHAATAMFPGGQLFEEFGRAQPSPLKCYGRTSSAATGGAQRRMKRAVSANSDSETISNTTKRSRSTSDARSCRVLEASGIKPLPVTRASKEFSSATSNQLEHQGPRRRASSSTSSARGFSKQASAAVGKPCVITVGDTQSTSSCSSFHLQVQQPSEMQTRTSILTYSDTGKGSPIIVAISQSEKVASWLQNCESAVPVISVEPEDTASDATKKDVVQVAPVISVVPEDTGSDATEKDVVQVAPVVSVVPEDTGSDATEKEVVQVSRKSMPNRFFTISKPVRKLGSPAGKKKLLDVSDSDPYKFVPSQKALNSAKQKGKRVRRRGGGKGTRSAPARKMKAKCPSREFENLRDYCAEDAAGKNMDTEELEIELFVTPADMPQGPKGQVAKLPQPKKRTLKDTSRQSKRMKRSLQLLQVQEETRELQEKINEAESFELTVLKETGPGLSSKSTVVSALKDVSNLTVALEKSKAKEYPGSPKRPGRAQLGSSAQKGSAEVTGMRQTLSDRTSEPQSGPRTDTLRPEKTSSLSLSRKPNLVNTNDLSKLSIPDTVPKEPPPSKNISRVHEETEGEAGGCKPVVNENQADSSHIECQDGEDNHAEENIETPAMSLKDLEGLFKKSSRKTFDLSADTQDMESLSSGAVNTLDLMSNICNEFEEAPVALRFPAAATAKDSSPAPAQKQTLPDKKDTPQLPASLSFPVKTVEGAAATAKENSPARAQETLPDKKDMPQLPASVSFPVKTVVQGGTETVTKNCTTSQETTDLPSSIALASTHSHEDTCKQLGNNTSNPGVESCVSCPNCSMDIVVSWVNGIAKVTLKGTSRKPVLVDVGMCTERPGTTRVIICKEVITQTDIQDVLDNSGCEAAPCQGSHQDASPVAALPVPLNSTLCVEVSPTVEKEVDASGISNHASSKEHIPLLATSNELHSKADGSDKPVEGETLIVVSEKPFENVPTSPPEILDVNKAGVGNAQAEMAEVAGVSETVEDVQLSPKQDNEGSEVLCAETEEQFQVSEKQSPRRGFRCCLQTIIEDTEQMDTSPSSENESPDEVEGTPVRPLVGRAEDLKHGSGDCTRSGLQCSVDAALPRSQDELLTEKTKRCLTEQSMSMALSCMEKDVSANTAHQEMRKTGLPTSVNRMQNRCSRALSLGCSDETYLPSYDHSLASPEAKVDKPRLCARNDSQPRGSAVSAGSASIDFDLKEQGNPKPVVLTTSQGSVQLVPPEERQDSSCCHEKDPSVVMLASPAKVTQNITGYEDGKGCSETEPVRAEVSPWSSPLHSEKNVSNFNEDIENHQDRDGDGSNSDKSNFGACSASPEKQSDAYKGLTGERQKSLCVSKTSGGSGKVFVTVDDSDSDSSVMLDPMTESEANDLLQRAFAMEEDSPDEVALNFARRAVAPLRKSVRKHLSPELHLMAERCASPEKSTAALLKSDAIRASEREDDHVESTEGPSTVTVSSTFSGALDRTLKEQLLEQDIQEMKKQMLMLECELQRTTAGNRCDGDLNQDVLNDSDFGESEEDEAMRSLADVKEAAKPPGQAVGKEAAKADNWDNCFSDSDDETPDVVPPTPPRKLLLNKDSTYNRGKK